MLAICNSIPSQSLPSPLNLEVVSVKLQLKSPIIICLICIPPKSCSTYYINFCSYLNDILTLNIKTILLGDFNLPDINWDSLSGQSSHSSIICELIFKFNLAQFVTTPTHVQGNILDLVLCNDINLIHDLKVHNSEQSQLASDHFKIKFSIPCSNPPKQKVTSSFAFDYSKADWDGLSSHLLDFDFSPFYLTSDLDTVWTCLKQILIDSATLFIPKFKIRSTSNPKWFTPAIRHDLNCIHTLHRINKKHPTQINTLKLAKAEFRLQFKTASAKSNYESKLVHCFAHNNSNKIYNYIKSLSSQKSFPPSMHLGSTIVSTDIEKATLFNNYFHSVFSTTPFVLPPISSLPTPSTTLSDISITESDVFEALQSIDPTKATGPDGIGPHLLKFCSAAICSPLLHLFTQCVAQQNIPSEWRIHCITPVYKSGDKAAINNYRPISLLSCTSKILERIIHTKITDFITNSIISNNQFGFLSNRSSIQQLLIFLKHIIDSHHNHLCTDTIYLDFRKAFDTVSHPELLLKLWSSGITGSLWKWFRAYLSNRLQFVSVNGHHSCLLPVLSGVPQGSILGPLLFIIFINDLPHSVKFSHAFMYADDTKCLKQIRSPSDSNLLQNDLDNIVTWSDKWGMHFNETKCVHIRFFPQLDPAPTYTINHSRVSSTSHHKDLGVIMTSNLSWSRHHHLIITRAYRSLGLIRRSFSTNSTYTKRQLYLSLIRSQLTYCSPIWRPHLLKDIILLERVQKRATKYILNDYASDYKSRLKCLQLLPLMYFFELNDIMFFIKSLHHPTEHFNIKDYFTFSDLNTRSSTTLKLKHAFAKSLSNSSRHFYFFRLPRLWNSLPPINLESSPASIRSSLNKFLWSHFDSHFDPSNYCTYHYQCPCSKCISSFRPTNFTT